MFRMLIGAAIVVGLVGYGIVTPEQIQNLFNDTQAVVHEGLTKAAEATK